MTRVTQTRLGVPDGNCHAAALASIFGLTLADVPDPRWPADVSWTEHDAAEVRSPEAQRVLDDFFSVFDAWVRRRGLVTLALDVKACGLDVMPDGLAIGLTHSVAGYSHAVVCEDRRIVWDPHPRQDAKMIHVHTLEYFVALQPARLFLEGR